MRRLSLIVAALLVAAPMWAEEKEGGIIGTGILGQITRLGSIYVNGLHIQFADDISLEGVGSLDALEPGMTVAASVSARGDEWVASSIRRVPILVGPVTGSDTVMGVAVRGVSLPAKGWVEIDGFWSESGAVGTRVSPVAPGVVEASGPYSEAGHVGQLPFGGILPQHLDPHQFVTVQGTFADGLLNAERLQAGLFAGDDPDLVLAEGYLSIPDPNGLYRMIGPGYVSYTDRPEMIDPDELTIRCTLDGRMDFSLESVSPETANHVKSLCELD